MVDLSMFSLEGKSGFITGGAQGIGECLARAFAKETGKKIKAYQCNMTNPDSVNKMMALYMDDYGQIDFAINNAGIFTGDEAVDIEFDQFKSVIDMNLNGIFLTAQAAAKEMKKSGKGGSIISTASISGHVVNVPQIIANYCALKAGVIQLFTNHHLKWWLDLSPIRAQHLHA